MDLNLLMVLDAVLRERNVSRAAEKLGLTQAAVSNALSRLRQSLGDPLLVRSARGMVPTDRAQKLEAPLRATLENLQVLLGEGDQFEALTSERRFTLQMVDYLEFLILPNLSSVLSQKAPHMQFRALPLIEEIPFKTLESGEVDMAIGYFTGAVGSLYRKELFEDDFVVMLPKSGLDLKPNELSLKEFLGLRHAMVSPWGGLSGLVDNELRKRHESRKVVLTMPTFLMAPFIVEKAKVAVTLPRRLAGSISGLAKVQLAELPFKLPGLTISLLWHERSHQDGGHRWLRNLIGPFSKDGQA